MKLEWSEDLAVGHPLIDDQHRSIFRQFDTFLGACKEKRLGHLRELFAFLDNYVQQHFREEETLMDGSVYPDRLRHKEEHRIFIERLQELKSETAKTGPTINVLIRTNKALVYWLTEHIRNLDVGLAAFLRRVE